VIDTPFGDAVRRNHPISRKRGSSAVDRGANPLLDGLPTHLKPIGVVDDSMSAASVGSALPAGAARDTGMAPTRVADEGVDRLAGPPVVAEVDCLEVHALGLTLPERAPAVDRCLLSARPRSLTTIIGPSGAGKSTLAKLVGGPSPRPQARCVSTA
jgi:ABC-type glutathione transport system ATPase component